MRVSVCLAAYDGSRYILLQIESILAQLDAQDELVVVDDCSRDETYQLVEQIRDPRIRLFKNKHNIGVNDTFARAIGLANGDVLFLSDQDDIWLTGRKAYMLEPFKNPAINVVAANYRLIDADGISLEGTLNPDLCSNDNARQLRNLARIFLGDMNYYGCTMAFRTRFRDMLLPYPPLLECHDIWIAMMGNIQGSIVHLPEPTLLHRVHGGNASIVERSLSTKLLARYNLSIQFFSALGRLYGWNRKKFRSNATL